MIIGTAGCSARPPRGPGQARLHRVIGTTKPHDADRIEAADADVNASSVDGELQPIEAR